MLKNFPAFFLVALLHWTCAHENAGKTPPESAPGTHGGPRPGAMVGAYAGYSSPAKEFILGVKDSPPEGKRAASHVEPEEGFVVMMTQEQVLMIDEEDPFSPLARMERGLFRCGAHLVGKTSPPGISNFEKLMGDAKDPDPFLVSAEESGKVIASPYPLDESVAAEIEALTSQHNEGDLQPVDCERIEKILKMDDKMPLLHYLAAGCWQRTGEVEKSRFHIMEELRVNPSHPQSHLALADFFFRKGSDKEALKEIVDALYYWPSWDLPGKYLDSVEHLGCKVRKTEFHPEIFVEVGPGGAVVYAWPEESPWFEPYARCKAAFRYCPEVRMSFGMKAAPYKLSLMEEVVCLKLAAQAHIATGKKEDPGGRLLEQAAGADLLVEFALFEVIGKFNPDYMKFLPAGVRDSILFYIMKFLLTGRAAGEESCNPLKEKKGEK